MSDYTRQIIKSEAKRIREEITNGQIYGEFMDMNDADMVIVAAYLLGMMSPVPSFKRSDLEEEISPDPKPRGKRGRVYTAEEIAKIDLDILDTLHKKPSNG